MRVFFYLDDREAKITDETESFLNGVRFYAAGMEREKARQRTYDAMVRKAEAGHVTGGRTFGYHNIDVPSSVVDAQGRRQRSHVERHINEAAAALTPC